MFKVSLKLSEPLKGTIYVFISAFMYATLPILAKLAYIHGLEPSSATFYRYLFAFMILLIYQTIIKKEAAFSTSPLAIGQGMLLIGSSLFYFYALKSLSAGIGSIIFFTHPVLVAFLAIFVFKEPLGIKLGLGLIAALIGIILISGIFNGSVVIAPISLFLCVLASICYGLYVLVGQTNVAHISPIPLTATFALMGIIIVPVLFFRDFGFITSLTITQALVCLGMALLNTVLSIFFFLKGLQKIGASRASLVSTLEPVLSIILAMIILKEVFSPLEASGAVLILISMYLAVTSYGSGSGQSVTETDSISQAGRKNNGS